MICDLLTHQPVDLLPNRTKDSVTEWLIEHSTVLLVTRDGSSTYRAGIDSVNRPIVQIMDRFHLIQILYRWMSMALQRILPHHYSIPLNSTVTPSKNENVTENQEDPKIDQHMNPRQQRKWELIQTIKKQHQLGQSIRFLAKNHHLSRNTVKKYIELEKLPISKRKGRPTLLDGYIDDIIRGIKNNLSSRSIFEQIKQQGYKGSYSLVRYQFTKIRKSKNKLFNKNIQQKVVLNQKRALSLYWKPHKILNEDERTYLNYLLGKFPETKELYAFVQTFRDHFNQLDSDGIRLLLSTGRESSTSEIKRFCQFLYKDLQAILASIYYTYSNGLIEGQINRLKTIKRTVYGRAGFDLLRKRVLYHF